MQKIGKFSFFLFLSFDLMNYFQAEDYIPRIQFFSKEKSESVAVSYYHYILLLLLLLLSIILKEMACSMLQL